MVLTVLPQPIHFRPIVGMHVPGSQGVDDPTRVGDVIVFSSQLVDIWYARVRDEPETLVHMGNSET
ncbi:MAG: hypothetical protein ACKOH5_06865 [Acidimicrobiaceae bacterium]